jgi:hypothetical protein
MIVFTYFVLAVFFLTIFFLIIEFEPEIIQQMD